MLLVLRVCSAAAVASSQLAFLCIYLEYVRLQLGLLPERLPARLADLLRHGRLLMHPLDVLVD